jgi:osmotically-inducible protein OsmY
MNTERMNADLTHSHQSSRRRPSPMLTLLVGAGLGAALIYFLDPDRGRRRRLLIGDKAAKARRAGQRQASDAVGNARNHVQGVAAEVSGRMEDDEATDEQLVARVRAEMGRHVERARAIEVVADRGTVTLRGTALAAELPELVDAIAHVRGVNRVDNMLHVRTDTRTDPGSEPALQPEL